MLRAHGTALVSLLLLAAGSVPATPAEEPEVVILRPTAAEPIVGNVDVQFFVTGASEDEVLGAEVYLDGRAVARLEAPPWRTTVDAGDELGERFLEVRVLLRGGVTAKTAMKSLPLRFDEVDVRLVNLAVTVQDRGGDPIEGLERDAFRVLDEGRPVAIERWNPAPAGLAVAVVLDTSLTMRGRKLEAARAAAAEFVDALDDVDRVAVLAFDEELHVARPLTTDHEAAGDAIGGLFAGGGTALYDAIFEASELLRDVETDYRRVAIVLSDGRDESASGLEPGSFHTLDEAVRRAHDLDVVVYTIGLGAELDEQYDFTRRMTTADVLERIARSTGGIYRRQKRSSSLGRSYREILDELRHQYSIAYTPPQAEPGESWRSIEVLVDTPGAKVRTREGYYIR